MAFDPQQLWPISILEVVGIVTDAVSVVGARWRALFGLVTAALYRHGKATWLHRGFS
jgi:hypothetical protein